MKKGKYVAFAAAFLGGFLILQSIVTTVFMFADAFVIGFEGDILTDFEAVYKRLLEMVLGQTGIITLISNILTIIAAWLVFVIAKKSFFREVGIAKTKVVYFFLAVLFGFSLNIVMSLLLNIVPLPESWIESYAESASLIDTKITFMNLLSTAVIAPIAEELVFRGLVFTRLSKAVGVWPGALLSAILFGVCHGDLVWGIFAGLFGFTLAIIFYKTKSLVPCMLAHIAFNTCSFVITKFDVWTVTISFVVMAVSFALILVLGHNENVKESIE